LDAFEDLVREGGEVITAELRQRMLEAEWLVFALEGNRTLAGVAALKRPSKHYKEMVFYKARTPENPDEFTFEAGWFFVRGAFRGRKYSRFLLETLLTLAGGSKVYATTRETNGPMRRTNCYCGLVESGSPYPSDEGDYNLVLYVRHSIS
jgi:GNAT superfamily N-acetyltransferase